MVSKKCASCLAITVLTIACVFVVIGIIGLIIGADLLQNQVNNQLPLTAESDQVSSWEDPPVPIYLQFWLWECVNVKEVLDGGKPSIREIGPFTYQEKRTKLDVRFNDNATVSYRQPMSYTFLPHLSPYPETKVITMINVPFVTIVGLLRNQKNVTQEIVDIILRIFNESLYVNHTAKEWIWGYEDSFLKFVKNIPYIGPLVGDDHFGYFYGQNATDDGTYTVYTGKDDISKLNIIEGWNGNPNVPYWNDTYADLINGTDGSWFPPLYKKDLDSLRLYLFSTDVCRSLYAKYEQSSSVLGIQTELFTIPPEIFANTTINPDNFPYGLNYSGVLNVSSCRQGAPIFISLPHLLYGDDRLLNRIEGIYPDKNLHQTLFEVEPHTGLVLRAEKRLQINIYIQPEHFIDDMKNVAELVLPAMWINESTVIDQKSADDLNNQVINLFTIARLLSIGLISLGVVTFLITTIIYSRRRSRRDSSARLLYPESHSIVAQLNE